MRITKFTKSLSEMHYKDQWKVILILLSLNFLLLFSVGVYVYESFNPLADTIRESYGEFVNILGKIVGTVAFLVLVGQLTLAGVAILRIKSKSDEEKDVIEDNIN